MNIDGHNEKEGPPRAQISISSLINHSSYQTPRVPTVLSGNRRALQSSDVGQCNIRNVLPVIGNGRLDDSLNDVRTHSKFELSMNTGLMLYAGVDPFANTVSNAALGSAEFKNPRIGGASSANCSDDSTLPASSLNVCYSEFAKGMNVTAKGPSPHVSDTMTGCQAFLRPDSEPNGELRAGLGTRARRILDTWFDIHFDNPYPSREEKKKLMKICGIRLSQVNNYFGNRRMRVKRKIFKTVFRGDALYSRSRSALWREFVFPDKKDKEGLRPIDPPCYHDDMQHRLPQIEPLLRSSGSASVEVSRYVTRPTFNFSDSVFGQYRVMPWRHLQDEQRD